MLAKTTRDAFMVELAGEHPEYGWEINKGYATPYHRAALRRSGPSPYHRVSWRLGLLRRPDDLDELPSWRRPPGGAGGPGDAADPDADGVGRDGGPDGRARSGVVRLAGRCGA